ncbi:MAG TPA: hypothetical protein VGH40_18605 [Roseiarcus sp.]
MPDPRLPRGALARLGFTLAIGALAVFAAAGPRIAHAGGRRGFSRHDAPAPIERAMRGGILAEASRWLGGGNPTPFREPWCRDFVNFVLRRAGHPLGDRSHLAIAALRLGPRVADPAPGDLAVMHGHVAFFAGWDGADAFLALGGNQSRRVTIARFARRAVIAFVRPT